MNLKVSDAKREEGFTLIELLVVVIIIGILAAIAIPLFLNQRQRAWQGSVESDVRNAAIEIETLATRAGTYPANSDDVEMFASDGVILYYRQGAVDAAGDLIADDLSGFSICGQHEQIDDPAESVYYHSSLGGLQDWNDPGGACAFTTDVIAENQTP